MPGVLFAGIDDWMAIIVPVASIIIYLLNQIFDKSGQQNQQQRRQQQPFERVNEPTPEDDEVARMVREATQRSRERAERSRSPQPARRQEPARKPEPSRPDWRTRSSEVVEAEVVEDRDIAPRKPAAPAPAPARKTTSQRSSSGGGVAAHVDKYLGEHDRQFAKSVETTVNTDDVKSHLEEQVHAKFDHQVGTMDAGLAGGASERVPVEDANPGRAMLMSLFSQPQNFRQAFILQEVLDPPPIH